MVVIVVVVVLGRLLGSKAYGANGYAPSVPTTHDTPNVHQLRLGAFKPSAKPSCTNIREDFREIIGKCSAKVGRCTFTKTIYNDQILLRQSYYIRSYGG